MESYDVQVVFIHKDQMDDLNFKGAGLVRAFDAHEGNFKTAMVTESLATVIKVTTELCSHVLFSMDTIACVSTGQPSTVSSADYKVIRDNVVVKLTDKDDTCDPSGENCYDIRIDLLNGKLRILVVVGNGFLRAVTETKDEVNTFLQTLLRHIYENGCSTPAPYLRQYLESKFFKGPVSPVKNRLDRI